MNPEASVQESPFAALSYQEQQARWLEWRSRQLDYRPVEPDPSPIEKGTAEEAVPVPPSQHLPGVSPRPYAQRRELNQVLSRHAQAAKKAGAFHSVEPPKSPARND